MSSKNINAQQFLASLKASGFQSCSKVKRDIERLLKDPIHQTFFGEISAVISSKSVAAESETSKFNAINPQSKLNDKQLLNKHIDSLSVMKSEMALDHEMLLDALQHTTAYKDQLTKRLQRMQEIKTELHDKEEGLKEVLKMKQAQLRQASLLNHGNLKQVESTTDATVESFAQLTNMQTESDTKKQSILQVNLEDFLVLETDFTSHLTKFAKSNFKETSTHIDEESSQSFEILSITNDQLLQDQSEHCQEEISTYMKLAIHGYSNQKHSGIAARSSLASAVAIEKVLENRLTFYELAGCNKSHLNLISITDGIKKVKRQVDLLRQKILPQLVAKGLPLHKSNLLTGDYHKKLCKQKYISSKQKQVISFLLAQCARLSMVWMMLNVETRWASHAAGLAKALIEVFANLREEAVSQYNTLTCHKSLDVANKEPKAVIDTRDEAMTTLYQSLVGSSAQDAIVWTFQSVLDAANEIMCAQRQNINRRETGALYPGIKAMANAVDECQSVVASPDDEILCTASDVSANVNNLLNEVTKVKSTLPEAIEKVKRRKETLTHRDSSETAVRDLWVDQITSRDLMEVGSV